MSSDISTVWIYRLIVSCVLEQAMLDEFSPVKSSVVRRGERHTRISIEADQAGLIGLLRSLHQYGVGIVRLQRKKVCPERNGGAK